MCGERGDRTRLARGEGGVVAVQSRAFLFCLCYSQAMFSHHQGPHPCCTPAFDRETTGCGACDWPAPCGFAANIVHIYPQYLEQYRSPCTLMPSSSLWLGSAERCLKCCAALSRAHDSRSRLHISFSTALVAKPRGKRDEGSRARGQARGHARTLF